MKKIYNPKNMTYSFINGSGVETVEKRLNRELFNNRWKINNLLGKVNLDKMINESKSL